MAQHPIPIEQREGDMAHALNELEAAAAEFLTAKAGARNVVQADGVLSEKLRAARAASRRLQRTQKRVAA